MLIAKQPILYNNRMYAVGEPLPYDANMSKAWLESGSAINAEENIVAETEVSATSEKEALPVAKKPSARKKK